MAKVYSTMSVPPALSYPYFTDFEKGGGGERDADRRDDDRDTRDDEASPNADWCTTGTWCIARASKNRPSLSGRYHLDNNPKAARIAGGKRAKSFAISLKRLVLMGRGPRNRYARSLCGTYTAAWPRGTAKPSRERGRRCTVRGHRRCLRFAGALKLLVDGRSGPAKLAQEEQRR